MCKKDNKNQKRCRKNKIHHMSQKIFEQLIKKLMGQTEKPVKNLKDQKGQPMEEEKEKIIVSDVFAYGINKETDAKYFIVYESHNKVGRSFTETLQMTEYHNKYKKNPTT